MPTTPLLKVLSGAGIGSRRLLADAIREGRVEVNGEVVEDFCHAVNADSDRITLDGRSVNIKPRQTVYLMLNKPKDVLSTTKDERGRRTVIDLLPGKYRQLKLHLVGRLDKDSTGLLLLTNDGDLTYRLTHPSFEHEKEYHVSLNARLKPGDKNRLKRGIKLDDGITHRATIRELSKKQFDYSITIHEGRKRQVRRMFDSLSYRVVALKRVRTGSLNLGDLKEGEVRSLSPQEVKALLAETKPAD